MSEIWKDVTFNNNYQVSNLGNVRRKSFSIVVTRHGKDFVRTYPEKVCSQFPTQEGYLLTSVQNRMCYVHRLVAEAFIENPDNLPEVDHINSIRNDNKLENLRWATRNQNNQGRKKWKWKKNLKIDEENELN